MCLSWLSFEQVGGLALPGLSLVELLPFNLLQSYNPLLCTASESDPGLDDLKTIEFDTFKLSNELSKKILNPGGISDNY